MITTVKSWLSTHDYPAIPSWVMEDPKPSGPLADKPLPLRIERRYRSWHSLYVRHLCTHYIFGILGGVASALAGFKLGDPTQQICAGLATASIAVLGFVRPERKYQKFVMAWRTLDAAVGRFQCGRGSEAEMEDAIALGEQQITVFESMEDRGSVVKGKGNGKKGSQEAGEESAHGG